MTGDKGAMHRAEPGRGDTERELRARAEEMAGRGESQSSAGASEQQVETLLHNLRAHKMELEMQNEELRRAQVELEASRSRYFELYDLAPVGYLTLDEKGMVQEANLHIATLLGLPRLALVGQPLSRFVLAADQDIYYLHRNRLRASMQPQTCELRLQRSDGSPFWARLDAMSVAGQVQGQAAATRITVTDISEHKRLHEQLLQAQKMQAVGTLAGGVAHDINNMLAVVLGLGSLLEHEMGSEDPRISHVRGIVFAAEQGKHLVQSLLGFAREGQYERTACSLGEIAASVIDMLKRTISKQVVVEAHLDPQLDEVEGDPTQLTQTLLNLCLNASDALDGAGTVTISTSNTMLTDGEVPELAAGRYVKLQVRDTGRGMSEPTRLRAFDPFFTTKGTGEGTGLGLSMAYGVIKNHRGALALESDLGAGTTASLWLPALESRAAVLPKAAKAQTKRVDEKPTLLIVDDEKMVATVVKLMVESLGCKVIVANSGARALEIYRDDPESIDLVILDLSMPGMDGAECFEKLKELDSHVRVFISTGHGSSEKIERMLAQGALGVMRKPFSLHELSQMLAETLGEAVRAR